MGLLRAPVAWNVAWNGAKTTRISTTQASFVNTTGPSMTIAKCEMLRIKAIFSGTEPLNWDEICNKPGSELSADLTGSQTQADGGTSCCCTSVSTNPNACARDDASDPGLDNATLQDFLKCCIKSKCCGKASSEAR